MQREPRDEANCTTNNKTACSVLAIYLGGRYSFVVRRLCWSRCGLLL